MLYMVAKKFKIDNDLILTPGSIVDTSTWPVYRVEQMKSARYLVHTGETKATVDVKKRKKAKAKCVSSPTSTNPPRVDWSKAAAGVLAGRTRAWALQAANSGE